MMVLRHACLSARLKVRVGKRTEFLSTGIVPGRVLIVSFAGRGCYPLVSGMCLLSSSLSLPKPNTTRCYPAPHCFLPLLLPPPLPTATTVTYSCQVWSQCYTHPLVTLSFAVLEPCPPVILLPPVTPSPLSQ